MKKLFFAFAAFALSFISVGSASAHVRLDPATAVIGRQIYNVRVPNEKDIPTIKVSVVVPEGVDVTGILPIVGWQHSEKKVAVDSESSGHGASNERITEVTWEGGSINAGEFMHFSLATNYQGEAKDLVWKAYQTYSDGTVVAWDDSSDDAPAPKVAITSESQLDTLENSVEELKKDDGFLPDNNTWIALGAVVVAFASLVFAVRKKS